MIQIYTFIGTKDVLCFDGNVNGISKPILTTLCNALSNAGLNPFEHVFKCVDPNVDYDYFPALIAQLGQ